MSDFHALEDLLPDNQEGERMTRQPLHLAARKRTVADLSPGEVAVRRMEPLF